MSRPRIRTRHLRKRCSRCKEAAQRFQEVGPERRWFCMVHFEDHQKEQSDGVRNSPTSPETP
jgi:hypothetical protein